MPSRVAIVTGASSGIGGSAALELAELGFTVYAAARRVERMEHLRASGIRPISLDVTDEASLTAAVARIIEVEGRIDVLVNNAGYGSFGSVEEVPLDEGRRQFDVNLFGAIRLTQLVIPHMRKQRSGRIINVTSIGGKIYTPLGAWYHGTKFALEGMSDVLRAELKPFGIDVVVIEPGAIKTEWSGIAAQSVLDVSGSGPYEKTARRLAAQLTGAMTDRASDPAVIGKAIVMAATTRRPKTRYAVGSGARLILTLRRLLSDRTFDRLISRTMA
ncbi:oxidoreductase [Leifsonia aquatica]|uniref:oxidoreductase n=1 Tax=Leifsonia aquatica TaxID=144185 RepID=UPI0004A7A1A0|nr:oxidoreductase [Leifsonia aquatica]